MFLGKPKNIAFMTKPPTPLLLFEAAAMPIYSAIILLVESASAMMSIGPRMRAFSVLPPSGRFSIYSMHADAADFYTTPSK